MRAKKKLAVIAGAAISASAISRISNAAIIVADANTYVDSTATTSDFSTSTTLLVKKNTNSANNRVAFVKFDTSSVTRPVQSASLTFTVATDSAGIAGELIELFGIPNGGINEDFNADTTTYTTSSGSGGTTNSSILITTSSTTNLNGSSPASATAQTNSYHYLTYLGTISLNAATTAGQSLTFTTTQLTTFVNADANHISSFLLTSETPSGSGLISIASITNPTYSAPTLATVSVPEPVSAVMLLPLAGAVILGRRRSVPAATTQVLANRIKP